MSILTKNALSASNQASFPDNTTGAITPLILRDYNQSVIDTLVDSLNTGSYAITTGSNDFTQANSFTSISASSFVSASFFVGDGSKLTNITASTALPISDEGILQGYATQLNFSGSNISASLNAGIATISVTVNNLVTTSSFNSFTASVNTFTASQETKNTTLATYTASVNTKFTAVGVSTASLNQFTSSQETKNSTLATYTASVNNSISLLNTYTASNDTSITNLNSFTSSQNTKNTTLASYTGSNDTKWSNLGSQSGSFITESETGSFARTNVGNTFTGSNTFVAGYNTEFDGNVYIGQNQNIINGGATNLTISSTSTNGLFLTSPNSNITLTALGQIIPKSFISSSLAITASFFVGDGSQLTNLPSALPLTSLNSFTASQDTKNATLAIYTASVDTKFTSVGASTSSLNTATASLFTSASLSLTTASVSLNTITFRKGDGTTFNITVNTGSATSTDITALNSFTASQLTINSAIGASTASLNSFTASQETKNTTLATYTASVTISLTNLNTYTASAAISTTNLNSFTASQNTKDTTLATYTASVDTKFTAVGVSTSSLNTATASLFTSASLSLTTASFSGNTLTFRKGDGTTFGVVIPDVSGSNIPTGTISGSAQITALGFVSSSVTASSLITASVSLNTITFTKGDATTFNITVNTGSAVTTDTGSLMRTGSVAGNVLTFTKGDATTFTLTVATGSAGGAAFPFTGDAVITGSLGISGSMFGGVIPITVVSSTASIDFSKGNMFTLTLPAASTHIVPTNIRAGQTCNIQITQPTPSTGSVLFSPLVLFAGGNDYQATTTGSAVDMLSLVSFNGTNTIATSIKNFL